MSDLPWEQQLTARRATSQLKILGHSVSAPSISPQFHKASPNLSDCAAGAFSGTSEGGLHTERAKPNLFLHVQAQFLLSTSHPQQLSSWMALIFIFCTLQSHFNTNVARLSNYIIALGVLTDTCTITQHTLQSKSERKIWGLGESGLLDISQSSTIVIGGGPISDKRNLCLRLCHVRTMLKLQDRGRRGVRRTQQWEVTGVCQNVPKKSSSLRSFICFWLKKKYSAQKENILLKVWSWSNLLLNVYYLTFLGVLHFCTTRAMVKPVCCSRADWTAQYEEHVRAGTGHRAWRGSLRKLRRRKENRASLALPLGWLFRPYSVVWAGLSTTPAPENKSRFEIIWYTFIALCNQSFFHQTQRVRSWIICVALTNH